MKRNKHKYMLGGAVLAAAWISSGNSAFGQSIVYQLSRSDTTSNLAGISNRNVVSVGSQNATQLSFDILALVSGGPNVSNNTFDFGEFKVSSSASGAAAVLPGNLTFTPAAQYQATSTGGTALFTIPSSNTTSTVGAQIGNPSQAVSPVSDASTVLVDLGVGSTATALGIETISGTDYHVFKLGTLSFTTTAVAASGQADTISVVPVTAGAGSVYFPQKAFINGTLTSLQTAGSLNLNIITAGIADVNADGSVDSTDLGIVVNRYGNNVTNGASSGDFNGDGVVDSTDLGLLVNRYGTSGGGALLAPGLNSTLGGQTSTAVPEPTTLSLLVAAPLLAMRRRRAK